MQGETNAKLHLGEMLLKPLAHSDSTGAMIVAKLFPLTSCSGCDLGLLTNLVPADPEDVSLMLTYKGFAAPAAPALL